jgi:hypothetical protein
VSAGSAHACAVRTDGTLACWGSDAFGREAITPPPGTFTAVTSDWFANCAIRTDGALVCWGESYVTLTTPAPVPAAPVLATAPSATPKPKAISAAKAFSLPSARACVSRRKFTIRIRKLPGVTWTGAKVRVRGKLVRTIKRSRITAPVNLTGLPRGRFTVAITATATDKRSATGKRTYHTCTRKRASSGPKL